MAFDLPAVAAMITVWESAQQIAARVPQSAKVWFWPSIIVAGSILLALILHSVLFAFLRRLARPTGSVIGNSLVRNATGPTRWIFPLLAIDLAVSCPRLFQNVLPDALSHLPVEST